MISDYASHRCVNTLHPYNSLDTVRVADHFQSDNYTVYTFIIYIHITPFDTKDLIDKVDKKII